MDELARLIGYKDVELWEANQRIQVLLAEAAERERIIEEKDGINNALVQAMIDNGHLAKVPTSVIEQSETATSIEELPLTLPSVALNDKTIQ
jgi:hypothetical protein